jgi:hypothetical protein
MKRFIFSYHVLTFLSKRGENYPKNYGLFMAELAVVVVMRMEVVQIYS